MLGSYDTPGSFGTEATSGRMRIVWHYSAADETRTFVVRYRLTGATIAHADVAEVNLQVWGGEWKAALGRLHAELVLPRPVAQSPAYRAWGAPGWVHGQVELAPKRVALDAVAIPAHQWVELRAVVPRSVLTSTTAAKVDPRPALVRIVGEEAASAAAAASDRAKLHDATSHPWRTLLELVVLAFVPAVAVVLLVWLLRGREPSVAYDREYEQEPPDDLPPALVPPLLRQEVTPGSLELTATIFDLVRRGRYRSEPVTSEVSTWGGVRKEQVADIAVSQGDRTVDLTDFEQKVAEVVDDVVGDAAVPLSEFRGRISSQRATNAQRFTAFKSRVEGAIAKRRWYDDSGRKALGIAAACFLAVAAVLLAVGISGFDHAAPRWSDVVQIALGGCCAVNGAALLGAALGRAALWRRRRPDAALEAARWDAFRRYLTDFPRLDLAPPATLELWERLLVYGIAFGVADRVLQAAQLHMPEPLHDSSTIFWITPTGGHLGSGPSALAIGDLSAGFGSALTPPSSSGSGGFGGGFSGGGFGGSGGGGGGAW